MMHGNLFFLVRDQLCTRTKAFAKGFVRSSRSGNQEMGLVVICQVKCDARFAGFSSLGKDVMIEKKILQLMILWICTVIVVIVW